MARISRATAVDILSQARANNCDYHALNTDGVQVLKDWAKEIGYRAPAANKRNGSPTRYFHAYLCRAARREE
jgi:hypothetical protein